MGPTRLAIIGGGPAGNTCATVAATLGAEVTLVERDVIGGAAHLWDCFSNLRSTRCRQLLDEGLGRMDASTANSIRAIRNARLQATLTLEQIGQQLSQSEEAASHYWMILVLAQQELAKQEESFLSSRKRKPSE